MGISDKEMSSFEAASQPLLMRHQNILRCGIRLRNPTIGGRGAPLPAEAPGSVPCSPILRMSLLKNLVVFIHLAGQIGNNEILLLAHQLFSAENHRCAGWRGEGQEKARILLQLYCHLQRLEFGHWTLGAS